MPSRKHQPATRGEHAEVAKKIRKLKREGMKQKQAVAAALEMWRNGKL